MFKKIQNYLLINYPLLWNIKIVPMASFLIVFNIIFFFLGYVSGEIDFTTTGGNYYKNNQEIILFFGVLISILLFIVWLVFYLKNNGFKSFYPKRNNSLFKEWFIIFSLLILISSFSFSFLFGSDLRVKSYYSEKEATKRCATLAKASLFLGYTYDGPQYVDKMINDTLQSVPLDHVLFNNKKYSLESLINKDIENFSFFEVTSDSLTKIKIKNWLVNQQKDSIKAVMNDFFKIANEHNLRSNVDAEKWFSIVYNYPTFTQTLKVAKEEKGYYNNYGNEYANSETTTIDGAYEYNYDSINQYTKTIGKEKYIFNRNYVPAEVLFSNYEEIASTYTSSSIKEEMILFALYFSFGLAIVIFSFRISSGRNWLIALVSLGVLNILLGILSGIFGSEKFYLSGLLVVSMSLFIYFIFITSRKTTKGISPITLNGLLWLFPTVIPIVYYLLFNFLKYTYGYYERYDDFNYDNYPVLKFLKDNDESMLWLNVVFVIVMMYFFSIKIKKWKGIAEN